MGGLRHEGLTDGKSTFSIRYHGLTPAKLMSRWAYAKKHQVQLPDEYDQIVSAQRPYLPSVDRPLTSSTEI